MKKKVLVFALFCIGLGLYSCGGSKKGTKCTDCPTWGSIETVVDDKV